MIIVRKGNIDDLEQIIYVNRKTWKTTYQNIIDKDFLENLSLTVSNEELENKKQEIKMGKAHYIVALDDNNVIGMLKFKKSNYNEYENTAEIQALYILKDYQNKGIGKKMVSMAINEMKKQKYKNLIIGCIEKNPSNEFYKKIGGKYIGKREFLLNNKTYQENVYLYENI